MNIWLTIFLTLMVCHKVQPQPRLVVNTTCMELAKPSNEHLRLTCHQDNYHCLLDETLTQEFELCKEWKWIPAGNCAYVNRHEDGNIDGRPCISSTSLICPKTQYFSRENTKYAICYMKKITQRITPTTSSVPFSETNDNGSDKTWKDTLVYIAIAFGVIILSASVVVICYRYRRVNSDKKGTQSSDETSDNRNEEQNLLIYARNSKLDDRLNMMSESEDYLISVESRDGNKVKESSADTATMFVDPKKLENKDLGVAECGERSQQTCVIIDNGKKDDEESTGAFDDTVESVQKGPPPRVTSDKKGTQSSDETSDDRNAEQNLLIYARNSKLDDRLNMMSESEDYLISFESRDGNKEKESSADTVTMFVDPKKLENKDLGVAECGEKSQQTCVIIDNGTKDDEESTGAFDDTVESLQRRAPPRDKQDPKLNIEIYNLLSLEGLKLSQAVMEAIIKRLTGKSVQELIDNETVMNMLTEILPEEFYRPIGKVGCQNSFLVSHSLLRIYLDNKDHPKSGWGNPVINNDIGIGDDIERLYRIYSIVCGISDSVTVSVEDYIRLLDIMMEVLTRLDLDDEFKKNLKTLAKERTCFSSLIMKEKTSKYHVLPY